MIQRETGANNEEREAGETRETKGRTTEVRLGVAGKTPRPAGPREVHERKTRCVPSAAQYRTTLTLQSLEL